MLSCGKLFQVLIIRSAKNVALAVQQECGLSILYGCPRVTLKTKLKEVGRTEVDKAKYYFGHLTVISLHLTFILLHLVG